MAQIGIQVKGEDIHAEFVRGTTATALGGSPLILDPISLSYSNLGTLCTYNMSITNVVGLTYYDILHNGKNSRFIGEGSGSCNIVLTVTDDLNNIDQYTITITII